MGKTITIGLATVAVIAAILALMFWADSSQKISQEEARQALASQKLELQTGFNSQSAKITEEYQAGMTQLNTKVDSISADLAKKQAEITAKDAEIAAFKAKEAAELVIETAAGTEANAYVLDEIDLDGDFAAKIDCDDWSGLACSSIDYNDDKYDFEEFLVFSADFKPVLNVEDHGADVLFGIFGEDAIEYYVEFDEKIEIVDDEELEIEFLGAPIRIVSYDGDELVYRTADEFQGSVGREFKVGGKTVKILSINSDSDKVLIDVDGKSSSIEDGQTRKINGVSISVNDLFVGTINGVSYVTLFIGDDITESIRDGDEYDPNDKYEWIINGDADGLVSLGLKLIETYEDDEDLFIVGDKFVLPSDYATLTFLPVKNLEVKDAALKVTNTKVKIDFAGTIEINGRKIDSNKFTVDDTLTYEYYYKGDKETGTDFSVIKLINGDREIDFDMTATQVNLGGYVFTYELGADNEISAAPAEMNDDENYRMANGDILYKSEANDVDDVEDAVKVGFVSGEEPEVLLKISS